jgi:DNA-directed RNA polymerase specialized sigma24 family protein
VRKSLPNDRWTITEYDLAPREFRSFGPGREQITTPARDHLLLVVSDRANRQATLAAVRILDQRKVALLAQRSRLELQRETRYSTNYKEIADKLGVTYTNVNRHITEGRGELRKLHDAA